MTKKSDSPRELSRSERNLNIASTIVLAVIVVTFIAAPTVTGFLGSGAVSFGSYAGRSIDHTNDNFFGSQVRQLAQFQSNQVPPEALWRQAFQNAAFRVAIQVEAEEAGVLISNPLIDNELRQFGPYLDASGQFSPQLFRETPDADRARYRQEIQESLLQQAWLDVRVTGPRYPEALVRRILQLSYPQRKFDYVSFSGEDFPLTQARSWGQENGKLFQTMVLSRITITTSEKDAQQVRGEAERGERTFESLAEAYSKDRFAQLGGSMGRVPYHELLPDFADEADLQALFLLPSGSLSPVFKTPVGWAFYRVQEAAKPADLQDEQTLKAIREYLIANERGLVDDFLKRQAEEFTRVARERNWEAAVRQVGKTSRQTDFLAINFGNHPLLPSVGPGPDGELAGLSSSEEFYRQAFVLPVGGLTPPLGLNRRIFVFRLAEVRTEPPADQPQPDSRVEQAQFFISNQRISQYQNLLLSSYKFRDNFEEGFRQRLRTFQD